MGRKKKIEDMKEIAKERGGECLSKNYISSQTKLEWKCKEGHIFFMKYNSIQSSNQWCPKCARKRITDSHRFTMEYVKEIAKKKNCECLSENYINSDKKMKFKCEKGHIFESTFYCLSRSQGCTHCRNLRPGTLEDMYKIAEKRGWKCLSKEYINNHTKVKWQCEKGHIWESKPGNITSKKYGCPYCYGHMRKDINYMQKIAEERGWKCMSDEYINSKTKLEWECNKGHIFLKDYNSIQSQKQGCPICSHLKKYKRKSQLLNIEDIKKEMEEKGIEKKGIKLLSETYVINHKLKWKCSEGHIWYALPYTVIKRGCGCLICDRNKTNLKKDNKKLTISDINNLLKSYNLKCECISTEEYVNNKQKLKWRCEKGHIWNTKIGHIFYKHKGRERGTGCPYCAKVARITLTDMHNLGKERGGKCLSTICFNANTLYDWECKEGHTWKAKYSNVKQNGTWCPYCTKYTKREQYCREILEKHFKVKFNKIRPKWLTFLKKPLELDGLNPSIITPIGFGLAFEHNGLQHYRRVKWFNKKRSLEDIKRYDKFKMNKCKKLGILVIIIPYYIEYIKIEEYILKELEKYGILLNQVKLQKKLTEYD